MTITRVFKRVTLATVLVALTAFAIADNKFSLLAVVGPLMLLGWWLSEGAVRHILPRWAMLLLVLAVIARSTLVLLAGEFNVSGFCEFLTLILAVKVWDRKRPSDFAQIITLSAFLGIGAMLTSAVLVVGLLLALLTALLVAAAVLFQLHSGASYAAETSVRPGAILEAPAPPALWRTLRRCGAGMLIAAAGVAALVFIGMPRGLGQRWFGNWGEVPVGRVTSFSDRVDLGRGGAISESQRAVLDLFVCDEDGNSLVSPGQVHYLRGAVLDVYANGSWVPAPPRDRATSHLDSGAPRPIDEFPAGPRTLQRITIKAIGAEVTPVFALWQPLTVEFEDPAILVWDRATKAMQRRGEQRVFQYTITSADAIVPESAGQPRVLPPGAPTAVAELTEQVLSRSGVPANPGARARDQDGFAARLIESYLRNNFTYTLDLSATPPGREPVEWFLFEEKRGHCEYFASSMALMCRAAGIPARVITGYVASGEDISGSVYVVRESHAHAWVEAEVWPGIWRRYDPTPPGDLRRLHKPRSGILAALERAMDNMNNAWNLSIVGFDQRMRDKVVEAANPDAGWVGRRLGALLDDLRSGDRRMVTTAARRGITAALLSLAVGFGFLFATSAGRAWWARRRKLRRTVSGLTRSSLPAAELYAELLLALERLGFHKPDWATPGAFATSVGERNPPAGAVAGRVVRAYYESRFGGLTTAIETRASLRGEIRAMSRLGSSKDTDR